MKNYRLSVLFITLNMALIPAASHAGTFSFTTGSPDGRIATASQPGTAGRVEIESADDFILSLATSLNSATFTGLITGASPTIGAVTVEIYRVFPFDSTNPPSGNVPTRVNSPSDVAFDTRSTLAGTLTFTTATLSPSFNAANSVLNGINKVPNQTTGGEGPVTGTEVLFNINFSSLLDLPANHYFFVPQVQVTGGQFYWLSAAGPTVPGDLQEWIRNGNLDPDWLRVGTDIVGGAVPPRFNAAFSLNGTTVPDTGTSALLFGVGLAALGSAQRILAGARAGRP